jgi:DNA polymerase-3 subunit beta
MSGVIIPRKTIGLMMQFCEEVEMVGVGLSTNKIRCQFGATTLVSKLIDGQFPDYARVIPTDNQNKVIADRHDMAAAIERVSTVSTEKGRAVKVSLSDGKAVFTVISAEVGAATEEMEVDYSGIPFDIGFNSRYLMDILSEIGGEKVEIELADPGSPTLFREAGAEDSRFVLMPMRVA